MLRRWKDEATVHWPIRNQVLLPMVGLLGGVIVCLSIVSARLASNWLDREMTAQAESMQRTLSASRFPLTSRVLQQMAGLSRAEYALVAPSGELIAASDHRFASVESSVWSRLARSTDAPARLRTLRGDVYYHRSFMMDRRPIGGDRATLHVLFPAEAYRQAWRRAVYPPLAVGGLACVVAAVLSTVVARRVTAPLARLERHSARVSRGDFTPLDVPSRRDEIRRLVLAINRMAELLASYEQEVREGERMATLTQLGSGMAHQIRNAATGCRLAIDLHRQALPAEWRESEDLSLATEQLRRIEGYLERFLQMGRSVQSGSESVGHEASDSLFIDRKMEADAAAVVASAVRQVRPMAVHLDVALAADGPDSPCRVAAQPDSLEQALVNLLRNAVEAASKRVHVKCLAGSGAVPDESAPDEARVRLECLRIRSRLEFRVYDNGAGPDESVAPRLYRPFVTDKQGGTGLGLALVAWVAESYGGSVEWHRRDGETCFLLRLRLVASEEDEGRA